MHFVRKNLTFLQSAHNYEVVLHLSGPISITRIVFTLFITLFKDFLYTFRNSKSVQMALNV